MLIVKKNSLKNVKGNQKELYVYIFNKNTYIYLLFFLNNKAST